MALDPKEVEDAMVDRLYLHEQLCTILGSSNVYYQPPEGVRMQYPCIKYEINEVYKKPADNSVHGIDVGYQMIFITRNPDDAVFVALSNLPHTRFSRSYCSEGLHHYVFSIY